MVISIQARRQAGRLAGRLASRQVGGGRSIVRKPKSQSLLGRSSLIACTNFLLPETNFAIAKKKKKRIERNNC